MILKLILICLFIIIGKQIYEIHNFNHDSILQQLQNANQSEIFYKLKERNPLIIHNISSQINSSQNINLSQLIYDNPGYIIHHQNKNISLASFNDKNIQQMDIYKNSKLIPDFQLNSLFDHLYSPFQSSIHCNKNYFLSLFKGSNAILCSQNKHNLLIFYQIQGNSTFYIFNPKHHNDILNKNNNDIKKWGQKINLIQGLVLYIPIEWYYFFETENESILATIESDNYFTVLYNLLR